jgi:hypothetical protein
LTPSALGNRSRPRNTEGTPVSRRLARRRLAAAALGRTTHRSERAARRTRVTARDARSDRLAGGPTFRRSRRSRRAPTRSRDATTALTRSVSRRSMVLTIRSNALQPTPHAAGHIRAECHWEWLALDHDLCRRRRYRSRSSHAHFTPSFPVSPQPYHCRYRRSTVALVHADPCEVR